MLDWDWRDNITDIPTFIENTLKLLNKYETKTSDYFGIPSLKCHQCKKCRKVPNQLIYGTDTSILIQDNSEINFKQLIDGIMIENYADQCCRDNWKFDGYEEKCVIFHLSHPVPVNIEEMKNIYGGNLTILSIVNQKTESGEIILTSSFNVKVNCIFKTEKEKYANPLKLSEMSKYCPFLLPSQIDPL